MKRFILGSMIVAVALVGCQRSSQEQVAEERQDLAETREEARQDIAETRQQAGEEIVDERQELAKTQREANEERGLPVTVSGMVKSVDDESFALETAAGDTLDLDVRDDVISDGRPFEIKMLQEGAQVRASYQMDEGERIVKSVEILAPAKGHEK